MNNKLALHFDNVMYSMNVIEFFEQIIRIL